MICDGRHLHPGIVRLLLKIKGTDRTIAVTDSIMAAGLSDGRYRLGVNEVIVEKGDAKLADTGTRAGSTLTMDIGDGRGEQRYRADDTGSGVKGNHIDVCVGDHQTAEELGRRTASVVWAAPEEKGDA